ncbi:hypothetical protein PoB_005947200 [Plakobranchus ocellatus]|uniref:Uncharacterized protein n=1 Tax=Plakobranchus ocellatus TaxID=259542 RepID=A0AAV4CM01_9GAST|nr:hypothetical protein PoB_005947200 [Plakobranchus ocellatus]
MSLNTDILSDDQMHVTHSGYSVISVELQLRIGVNCHKALVSVFLSISFSYTITAKSLDHCRRSSSVFVKVVVDDKEHKIMDADNGKPNLLRKIDSCCLKNDDGGDGDDDNDDDE